MEKLAEQARNGDEDAFRSLMKACERPLRARIGPKIGPSYRGILSEDDVLQVTFLDAILKMASFEDRGDGSFLAWITTLAEHNLSDAHRGLRRKKREPRDRRITSGSSDSYTSLIAAIAGDDTTPTEHARGNEAKGFLDNALDQIAPDYAKVVRLYDLEEKPIQEVADALGRTRGAVHMLRARAHDCLREKLGETGRFFTTGS